MASSQITHTEKTKQKKDASKLEQIRNKRSKREILSHLLAYISDSVIFAK